MSRTSGRLLCLLAVVLLLLLPSFSGAAVSATRKPAVRAPQTFGVSLADVPGTMQPLQQLSDALGRRPTQVMWYVAWSAGGGFPTQQAAAVAAFGATPVITWEPWDPTRGVDQPAYSLDAIAGGAFDAYVTTWARQIRAYGKPVTLRFAHEMNGSWYPWAAGVNGNTAGDYVAAWRHVRAVFAKQKVTNAAWSWSPNVPYAGRTPLRSLYPGDALVEQVALDGYNWGGVQAGAPWQTFWDVFDDGVAEVRGFTAKPLHVGEVAAPEAGGDKAQWVTDMFSALKAHPEVAGFTWFSHLKEADWRIDSSPATLEAFRTGLTTY